MKQVRTYKRWFAIHKSNERRCGGSWREYDQLSRTISNLRTEWNIFLGLNPSSRFDGIKASDNDIVSVRYILLDLDPINGDRPPTDPQALAAHILQSLHRPLPFWLVDTGRGFHALLCVDGWQTPMSPEDRFRWPRAIAAYLRQVSAKFGTFNNLRLDLSCSDLSRVARAGGSINHKTGRPVVGLGIFDNQWPNIDPTDFLSEFFTEPEPSPTVANPNTQLWQIFSDLPTTARRFLTEGAPGGARNHEAFVAALSIRERGLGVGVCRLAVIRGAELCRPPMDRREVMRIIENAYRRRIG